MNCQRNVNQYTKKKKKIQCVFNFEHGTPNVSGGNPQTRSASEKSTTEQVVMDFQIIVEALNQSFFECQNLSNSFIFSHTLQ
jgi:hypothetical protein